MKNLTLRVEESTLTYARRIAAENSTSVNALIRDYLDNLVKSNNRQEIARKELLTLCRHSTAQAGHKNWSREDLYDR